MDRSILDGYDPHGFYCEMLASSASAAVRERLSRLSIEALKERAAAANAELYNLGITFTVYSDAETIDRILPFDALPRVLSAEEWRHLESGITQRITAINLLLDDIYHDQRVLADGIVPADLILGNPNYRPEMRGVNLPHKAYVNICGTDIVRDEKGAFFVLEDNARTPSGVSYVVENRHMMLRAFPDLLDDISLRPIDNYGARLIAALQEIAPPSVAEPQVVLLSPGTYNSAYFEHVFLAREMGVPLVEGPDSVVEDESVWMRTTRRARPRRRDLSPHQRRFSRPRSVRPRQHAGGARANARLSRRHRGARQCDRHRGRRRQGGLRLYAAGHPLLPRRGSDPAQRPDPYLPRAGCLAIHSRPSRRAGSKAGRRGRRLRHYRRPQGDPRRARRLPAKLLADPANYISQPCINLSVAPTLVDGRIEPRHVDLRPFAVTGSSTWVLPGGLTRVALRRGSLVVNSSQGGGSKDTWVLG